MTEEMEPKSRRLRSWRWLVPLALIPLVGWRVLKAVGGEECVQVMTGIQPFGDLEMLLGVLYLGTYLSLTLISPVLVIAAILVGVRDALFGHSE